MNATDAILLLWLALNTATLAITAFDLRGDLHGLRAVMHDLPTAPDRRPLLVVALRDMAQDALIGTVAALFDLAGVAELAMVHGGHRGDPFLTAVYILAFLVAAGLLTLKQGQRRVAGWIARRLYDASPWDRP